MPSNPSPREHIAAPSAHKVFTILVRENADMLTAFLRSLVTKGDAVDDLFQETMMVAWRRLGESDLTLPFGPWLRGIAANLVLKHRRTMATRSHLSCEPEVLEAIEAEFARFERAPGDSFRARMDRLSGCMEKLPPVMLDAVKMVYARGLSLRALAAAVNATEESVKKRLQRARQLLAECLETGKGAVP